MRTRTKPMEPVQHLSRNGNTSVLWLRADQIQIDPDTQRGLRPAWAKQLAANWDDAAVGVLQVSRRKDGFYAIDGQHRVWAKLISSEPGYLFECKIYNDLAKADEARAFSGLNNTKAVGKFDEFRVRLNYDADAQAIHRIIRSVGLELGIEPKDGTIAAVDACEQVYSGRLFRAKEPTPWALAKGLRLLTGAWGKNRDAVNASMLRAAGGLHLRYGDALDGDLMARKLALFGSPIRVINMAKIRREVTNTELWRAIAEVMVDIYNKGRRTSRLPEWSR